MKKYFLQIYIAAMTLVLLSFLVLIVRDNTVKTSYGGLEPGEDKINATALPVTVSNDDSYDKQTIVEDSTLMVYIYYYMEDGLTESVEESPPYFLIGKDRDYFEETFVDWEILEFSEDKVVMQKPLMGRSNQYYILGLHEGFVAVFYENENEGSEIKEITDTPAFSLPLAEQEKLHKGIRIKGDENLIRALEDYGS